MKTKGVAKTFIDETSGTPMVDCNARELTCGVDANAVNCVHSLFIPLVSTCA